ncbi:hypothetical protein Barb6_03759 [Bacteroidales bacterium Barb6]|nr:hypothetical protein Barb6_03759 [Bacteroidales bacterium Barb6]
MIPQKTGISFSIPRPSSETATAVSSAIPASHQFPFAISTPVPASDSPIRIMTGPITTDGKSILIKPTPRHFTRKLIRK